MYVDAAADPMDLLDRIVLVALVGIVDPPRPEARDAIIEPDPSIPRGPLPPRAAFLRQLDPVASAAMRGVT